MEKNRAIIYLRGIAICAVVAIHTFNIGLSASTGSIMNMIYYLINKLLQFAVPCFIFISSILITYSTRNKVFNLGTFYRKKMKRIVIPYVVWSSIYLGLGLLIRTKHLSDLLSIKNWIDWLLFGKSYTHLYYMSIMVQFYLVAPIFIFLLHKLHNKFKHKDIVVILISAIVLEGVIYYINKHFIYPHFKYTATLMIWYIYIIIPGMWIGLYYERFMGIIERNRYLMISILGISIANYVRNVLILKRNLPINTAFYHATWCFYTALISIFLLYLCMKYSEYSKGENKWLCTVSECSFAIYLIHPILTFAFSKLLVRRMVPFLSIQLVAVYLIILVVCVIVIKLIRKHAFLRLIIGEKICSQ